MFKLYVSGEYNASVDARSPVNRLGGQKGSNEMAALQNLDLFICPSSKGLTGDKSKGVWCGTYTYGHVWRS